LPSSLLTKEPSGGGRSSNPSRHKGTAGEAMSARRTVSSPSSRSLGEVFDFIGEDFWKEKITGGGWGGF